VLLAAAAVAVALANSSLAEAYRQVVEMRLGVHAGARLVEAPLRFWVNDGLMTIFFFVVGLEIRREAWDGELANLRRAAVPFAAALGGMVVPALIYVALTGGTAEDLRGWGVPMATDIAFAVGVLTLLGPRVPPALRVLLLALAIIDDIGSIVVIAVFYSAAIRADGVVVALVGLASIFLLQRFGVRRVAAYVIPGVVVWIGMLQAGVHPTIAGVVVGLATPAQPWLGATGLVDAARGTAERVERSLAAGEPGMIGTEELAREASGLGRAQQEALSPAVRLQVNLHPWVAFGIMPLFALANAGVALPSLSAASFSRVSVGLAVGLVVGKPVGIVLATLGVTRLLGARLPRGIGLRELIVLGLVAGIGFTMALFVAELAFPEGAKLDEARVAVVLSSATAIIIGLVGGRLLLPAAPSSGSATTATEAERSDDV
jgi:NhaA family Na+:H+ antiporter